jgi:hypothetical protein
MHTRATMTVMLGIAQTLAWGLARAPAAREQH